MAAGWTDAEISASFQLWSPLSKMSSLGPHECNFRGRRWKVSMMKIYGKLDVSDIVVLDDLTVSTVVQLPFALVDLREAHVWASAHQSAGTEARALEPAANALARAVVEHLRLENDAFDFGLSADREDHQDFSPLGTQVWLAAARERRRDDPIPDGMDADSLLRFAITPLWSSRELDDDHDAYKKRLEKAPKVTAEMFERSVTASAHGAPPRSNILRRDALDHRRDGDYTIATILAITACETRLKEVALARYPAGWQQLLQVMPKPTFGQARQRERLVFATAFKNYDAAGDEEMRWATTLRNNLIHNALTTASPTPATADRVLAVADAYLSWLAALP